MDTKIYNKQMRVFTKKMKELGFQKWKSTFFVRKTEYDVVEEIHIQRFSDGKEVTGNYGFSLLYQPYLATRFETSRRFGQLVYGKDHWWPLETEADCEKAFDDFYNIIKEKIIPEFNKFKDSKEIIKLSEDKILFFQHYIKILINLHSKNYREAKKNYDYTIENFDILNENEKDFYFIDLNRKELSEIPKMVFHDERACMDFLKSNIDENIKKMKYPFK
ncbi:hypothetical protein M2475_001840 [Breznakia sp. PF5-3]|uniref:DUF4304 domain-containing protein n=1 Tax=unclassified Breznakia TaxID=2623764 RepID=UPI0024065EC4|nr:MULTISPECIES: DUF4304 domain-containing protein [unclassified Breznakia]MDF9825385.1 hypothetical protein [Breznakia sp. PM6-1]MDF9836263.1 hypothetical protein [Breznakia sp. PF5-3]MDF9838976.1 hypothetical protein [Breznakia sp. PFB2-8]MDF9860508.1 hypothetical protein [Breznakia sp. PH5-24]